MDTRRKTLGAIVRRERSAQDLGTQAEFAELAIISTRRVTDVETGKFAGAKTYDAIERAMGFPAGSFEAYLDGGPVPVAAPRTRDSEPQREHSAEDRAWMRTLSEEEFLDYIEFVRAKRGATAAFNVMREIVAERERGATVRKAAPTGERQDTT